MARFVKPGDVMMNIGCHIGLEAMVMGQILGPSGKLFFFEPYSVSYRILQKNVFLNNLHRISTMFKMAVSNRRQEGYIFVDSMNTGGSEIHTDESAKTFRGIDHSNRMNVYI